MPRAKQKLSAVNDFLQIEANTLTLDDGFKFNTAKLTDEQYKRALQIGVAVMLSDGEIKPADIAR